jgi:lipoprotein NlpI
LPRSNTIAPGQAIRLKPDYAAAFLHRGHAREMKGDLRGALSDLESFYRFDPTDPFAQAALTRVREALKKKEGGRRN